MKIVTLTKVGDNVPAFTFETEPGKTVSISDYKGKLILINLFATWCPPCNAELPLMQKDIWEKHKNDPNFCLFVFGRAEDWEKVSAFKNEKDFTFLILPDKDTSIFNKFAKAGTSQVGIPRNIIIGKNGKIIYQSLGFMEDEFNKMAMMIDEKLK